MVSRSGTRANRRGIQSRQRVLDAAEAVMADEGFLGATLPKIVAAAGVPLSSIYHYFGSKDVVLHAAMEREATRMADAIRPAPSDTDPLTALTSLLDQLREAIEAHPHFFNLVMMTAETASGRDKKGPTWPVTSVSWGCH